jgi:hypothetical protein
VVVEQLYPLLDREMMEVYLLLLVALARLLLPLPVLLQPVVEVVEVVRRPELLAETVAQGAEVVHRVLAAVERVFRGKAMLAVRIPLISVEAEAAHHKPVIQQALELAVMARKVRHLLHLMGELVPAALHLLGIILEVAVEVHRLLPKLVGLAAVGGGLTLRVYLRQFRQELKLVVAVVEVALMMLVHQVAKAAPVSSS